jgi:acyl carrier protein
MNNILSAKDAEAVYEIIIQQLDAKRSQLTREARFKEDLNADSLDEANIAMAIEDRFQVTIPDERAESARTVGGMLDLLAALLAERDRETAGKGI